MDQLLRIYSTHIFWSTNRAHKTIIVVENNDKAKKEPKKDVLYANIAKLLINTVIVILNVLKRSLSSKQIVCR